MSGSDNSVMLCGELTSRILFGSEKEEAEKEDDEKEDDEKEEERRSGLYGGGSAEDGRKSEGEGENEGEGEIECGKGRACGVCGVVSIERDDLLYAEISVS